MGKIGKIAAFFIRLIAAARQQLEMQGEVLPEADRRDLFFFVSVKI